ncbi:MAG: carboxynorspermidine decarboxylase [Endomicrobium sp.]|jgi:carboxynorspermidine decarboxylase|nr:carboxynorspermidine decarboxylase [Endomicrobium sp.]
MKDKIKTPYYLIYKNKLLKNLKKIEYVRKLSGAKVLLALKCFSTWSVFNLISKYMDGTTSSSFYEAKLGYDKFGKETHIFSVAFSKREINLLKELNGNKIIFNSISQLNMFYNKVKHFEIGVRINPGISYSSFNIADPARQFSRLGIVSKKSIKYIINKINGLMFHYNCENDNFTKFSEMLNEIELKYFDILNEKRIKWVSLGGGISFTNNQYPINKFCKKLKEFSKKYDVQIYLEPGEAVVLNSCELVTTVLDIVENIKKIAIVDASVEAHMLDLLIYRVCAEIRTKPGNNEYIIAGRSCLAGDVFGEYHLLNKLKIGSIIRFTNAASYTMVKKNWFNGVSMPSIVVKELNGQIRLIKDFVYNDFLKNLS